MRKAIVTTSWDDGHPLELRVADLLARYGMKGTFYVPLLYKTRPVMDKAQIAATMDRGMEIGSHTLTHAALPNLTRQKLAHELQASRKKLEDMLGTPVSALCYPKGRFDRRVCAAAAEAGYGIGRTTVGYRTATGFDPFRMPVSCQMSRTKRQCSVRHALAGGNIRGLCHWGFRFGFEADPVELAKMMFDHVLGNGGVFHLWGHGWEVDESGLWGALEEAVRYVSGRKEVAYLTNTEVVTLKSP